jgi:cholesterol oxidase
VQIRAESEVVDILPVDGEQVEGRYEVSYRSSTRFGPKTVKTVRARNIILSAGVIGTMQLLLNLRDVKHSLPQLSARLGDRVRTNSEALLGSTARGNEIDFSKGIAISSIFNADSMTRVEPVRYPDGSSLMRLLSAPLIDLDAGVATRLLRSLAWALRHPVDFLRAMLLPGWARKSTILLVMQHADNRLKLRIGRSAYTLFFRGLVALPEPGYEVHAQVAGSHEITREFAARTNGVPMGSLGENLLNLPTTAHILGGAPMGKDASEGVVDDKFEVHNYPGLFIIDGAIMPANPGVNPSLTITALAEYAMSKILQKQ